VKIALILLLVLVLGTLALGLAAGGSLSWPGDTAFSSTLEQILASLGGIGDSIAQIFSRAVPKF
jgi:hypothetical protein